MLDTSLATVNRMPLSGPGSYERNHLVGRIKDRPILMIGDLRPPPPEDFIVCGDGALHLNENL